MKTCGARALAAIAAACGVIAGGGCASSEGGTIGRDHLYLDTSQVPCGHEGATIQILQEPPDRPFTKVAYLEAYAAFFAKDEVTWEDLRQELCQQAIEVGGDAIIDLAPTTRPYSRTVELGLVEVATGGVTKKLTGVAIRYGQTPREPGPPAQ